MKLKQIAKYVALSLLMMMGSCIAEVITIEDSKGRSIMVDLMSGNEKSIKIKRLKDGKVFSMPLSSLSQKSKTEIKKKLKTLKPEYPPLEADVVIGKRRTSENGYYSKTMTITAKVTVTNKDRQNPCPPCQCNIILVGESQSYKDRFLVLTNQSFELTPTDGGKDFETEPLITTYYKAYGYKYEGYLLVVSDAEGSVLLTKTLFPEIKKAIETEVNFVSKFINYPAQTYLNKSMLETELPTTGFLR